MKHDMPEGRKRLINISIFGFTGRMGQAIVKAAEGREDIKITDRRPDVFVDFSAPDAVEQNLNTSHSSKQPILLGTTGLRAEHRAMIEAAAAEIAVIQAANTSLGVNLLTHLVREAAARLQSDWDIEIVEMHHRLKA